MVSWPPSPLSCRTGPAIDAVVAAAADNGVGCAASIEYVVITIAGHVVAAAVGVDVFDAGDRGETRRGSADQIDRDATRSGVTQGISTATKIGRDGFDAGH